MSREIIIDGDDSDWFEKAIFILKDNKKVPNNKSLFEHAEEIIENKLKKMPQGNIIDSSKVKLNMKQENKLCIDKNRFKGVKKGGLNRITTKVIIDIFLYSALALAFICITCMII